MFDWKRDHSPLTPLFQEVWHDRKHHPVAGLGVALVWTPTPSLPSADPSQVETLDTCGGNSFCRADGVERTLG